MDLSQSLKGRHSHLASIHLTKDQIDSIRSQSLKGRHSHLASPLSSIAQEAVRNNGLRGTGIWGVFGAAIVTKIGVFLSLLQLDGPGEACESASSRGGVRVCLAAELIRYRTSGFLAVELLLWFVRARRSWRRERRSAHCPCWR